MESEDRLAPAAFLAIVSRHRKSADRRTHLLRPRTESRCVWSEPAWRPGVTAARRRCPPCRLSSEFATTPTGAIPRRGTRERRPYTSKTYSEIGTSPAATAAAAMRVHRSVLASHLRLRRLASPCSAHTTSAPAAACVACDRSTVLDNELTRFTTQAHALAGSDGRTPSGTASPNRAHGGSTPNAGSAGGSAARRLGLLGIPLSSSSSEEGDEDEFDPSAVVSSDSLDGNAPGSPAVAVAEPPAATYSRGGSTRSGPSTRSGGSGAPGAVVPEESFRDIVSGGAWAALWGPVC